MDKIDRLGWADGLMFSSFGVRIGIRVNQPDFGRSLEGLLPPGHKATSSSAVNRLYSLVVGGSPQERGVRRLNILYDGAQRLARERDLAPVLKVLEAQIRRTVAEMAPRRVFVHAGVVELRGRAIVIPGPSMSGKSTLVSELIRRGATYYSDEYAVLDDKGFVYPFAKPISLRLPGSFEGINWEVEQFGATTGVKSVPIGLVAITRYEAGAKWRPRKLTPGQGALALLSHSVAARRQPGRVMGSLRRALGATLILKGVRGEASELAQQLLETLEQAPDQGLRIRNSESSTKGR
jgi:hypothetical protein